MQLASSGVETDDGVAGPRGAGSFSIHGACYHSIGPLQPGAGRPPQFSQLYIHDAAHELKNRMRTFGTHAGLRSEIVQQLQAMVHQINHWVRVSKATAEGADDNHTHHPGRCRCYSVFFYRCVIFLAVALRLLACCRLWNRSLPNNIARSSVCVRSTLTVPVLPNAGGQDLRRQNMPTVSEVAAVMPGNGHGSTGYRDVVVQTKAPAAQPGRQQPLGVHHITDENAAWAPLHFVLLFARGDLGWGNNLIRMRHQSPVVLSEPGCAREPRGVPAAAAAAAAAPLPRHVPTAAEQAAVLEQLNAPAAAAPNANHSTDEPDEDVEDESDGAGGPVDEEQRDLNGSGQRGTRMQVFITNKGFACYHLYYNKTFSRMHLQRCGRLWQVVFY